ncbi:MAG TPA: hypothetical protein VFX38_08765 [Gammaproteobacteria bacterium]|nr:hypothetical protein [Gammaproteobacteria bacterium]
MSYLDTARQVMIELHGGETATKATKATKAPLLSHMSLLSQGCADEKAELKALVCDETGLQVRCFDACRGLPILPILPMALFASLTDDDRAAQYSGEEGPDVLRAYALAIADRLKRDDEAAAEWLAEREAIGAESGEPLRTTCPVFRFKLTWNPELWHYLLAPPGTDLAEARATLKRKHGDALLSTETFKPGACPQGGPA